MVHNVKFVSTSVSHVLNFSLSFSVFRFSNTDNPGKKDVEYASAEAKRQTCLGKELIIM